LRDFERNAPNSQPGYSHIEDVDSKATDDQHSEPGISSAHHLEPEDSDTDEIGEYVDQGDEAVLKADAQGSEAGISLDSSAAPKHSERATVSPAFSLPENSGEKGNSPARHDSHAIVHEGLLLRTIVSRCAWMWAGAILCPIVLWLFRSIASYGGAAEKGLRQHDWL